EGGLEGVLGVRMASQDAAADAPDHRSVPAHQRGEGGFLAALDVALQELAVGQAGAVVRERGPAEVLDDMPELVGRHRLGLRVAAPTDVLAEGTGIDR